MSEFPTAGPLTFLFTDIEGSTRKAAELGDEWFPILEKHHAVSALGEKGRRGGAGRAASDHHDVAILRGIEVPMVLLHVSLSRWAVAKTL